MTRKRSKKKLLKFKKSSIDIPFTLTIILLTLFGLLMVFNASIVEGYQQFNDKFHFVRLQSIWAVIGLLGMAVASFIPFSTYKKISQPIFILALLLLIGVLIPGVGVKAQGARRICFCL